MMMARARIVLLLAGALERATAIMMVRMEAKAGRVKEPAESSAKKKPRRSERINKPVVKAAEHSKGKRSADEKVEDWLDDIDLQLFSLFRDRKRAGGVDKVVARL